MSEDSGQQESTTADKPINKDGEPWSMDDSIRVLKDCMSQGARDSFSANLLTPTTTGVTVDLAGGINAITHGPRYQTNNTSTVAKALRPKEGKTK